MSQLSISWEFYDCVIFLLYISFLTLFVRGKFKFKLFLNDFVCLLQSHSEIRLWHILLFRKMVLCELTLYKNTQTRVPVRVPEAVPHRCYSRKIICSIPVINMRLCVPLPVYWNILLKRCHLEHFSKLTCLLVFLLK